MSNFLNRPEQVRAETRARVERAIAILGYRPSRHARMLAGGRDRGIGLIVHDTANPFFAAIADAVAATAEARGFSVVMTSSRADESRQDAAIRLLQEHQLSGILLAPTVQTPPNGPALAGDTPVVLLDHPGGRGRCSVRANDAAGGALAAQHLIEAGCRRPVFVGGPSRVSQHRDRLRGVRTALKAAGLEPPSLVSTPADTIDAGRAAVQDLLELGAAVDGAICGNDLLAVGLIRALGRAGIRVPDDVAVIGYDDIDLADLVSPSLSTVHQPIVPMGRAATELLLEEIDVIEHRHARRVLEPWLVARESTARSAHLLAR